MPENQNNMTPAEAYVLGVWTKVPKAIETILPQMLICDDGRYVWRLQLAYFPASAISVFLAFDTASGQTSVYSVATREPSNMQPHLGEGLDPKNVRAIEPAKPTDAFIERAQAVWFRIRDIIHAHAPNWRGTEHGGAYTYHAELGMSILELAALALDRDGVYVDRHKIAEAIINHHAYLYHTLGQAVATDLEFDGWESFVAYLGANVSATPAVGAEPEPGRVKIKLPVMMGSLDKARNIADVQHFIGSCRAAGSSTLILTPKIDGISIGIYAQGADGYAFTRGNGIEGWAVTAHVAASQAWAHGITQLTQWLSLQPRQTSVIVVGEMVMPRGIFDAKYASVSENPRNHVSGLFNRKTVDDETKNRLNDVYFAAFHALINGAPGNTRIETLDGLKSLGFMTPPYTSLDITQEYTDEALSGWLDNWLAHWRQSLGCDMDGLVLEVNETPVRQNMDKIPVGSYEQVVNPVSARAVKFSTADSTKQTKVTGIEWSTTARGIFFPTVLVEPVSLSGVTIQRLSGKNARFIYDQGIGKGAVITIRRAGDVIPDIVSVVSRVVFNPADYPPAHDTLGWKGVDLEAKHSSDQERAALVFFCRNADVHGVDESVINQLWSAGVMTLAGLVDPNNEAVYPKVRAAIAAALKDIPLWKLAHASALFPGGIGPAKMQAVCAAYSDEWLKWNPGADYDFIKDRIASLAGWSEKSSADFITGLIAFKNFMAKVSIPYHVEPRAEVGPTLPAGLLAGQVIAFSGFRSPELERHITRLGGVYAERVTKSTTLLLVQDLAHMSEKRHSATRAGIPVYLVEQFRAMIGI